MNPMGMPPGLMSANGSGGMGMRCGEMPSGAGQGPPGMMPQQQFAPPQQQFFVSPAMPAMPNCYSYGGPASMSGMCAYAPPGAGMGAGMYQPTPAAGMNLYQAPPQYAQQQQQQYVPQPQQYVPQQQQPFGMPQQSGAGAGGYAYQSPQGLSMGGGGMGGGGMGGMGGMGGGGGGGGMGGSGMGGSGMGGPPFNSHNGPSYGGYDDSDSYNSQPPGMFGGGPAGGYYRSS